MHVHHDAAHRWFAETGSRSWATCPLTENGFVRIARNPNYPNRPGEVPFVLDILRTFCSLEGHSFWSDELSIREMLVPQTLVLHRQITDLYLLGLAAHRGEKLVSFDQRIPRRAVHGGGAALELIIP